jgi:branched-chain amino acid transport system substrate-binding protein
MKMGKRDLLMRAGVCFVVAAFMLCLGSISQAAPKSIKVSSVLSLTGKMSAMGMQIKPSYEIFVDKVNAEGGIYVKEYGKKIPIELRVLDDESDPLKTQAQLEVANSWGAVANLGGLGCGSFEMGTPICMKNKMTWVGPGCGGWMPHQLGNQWLFSIFMKTPFFSPMVFDMILEQPEPRPKKVAIFEINQLDAREAAMYWLQAAKLKGFDVVFHKKYPAGTKDFSALITGAKAAGAEILLAYPIPPMGPAIVKQMKELDFNPKIIYWVRAPEGARFGPSLGKLADYVTLPCAWSPTLKFPGNDYVNAQYKKKMGRPSDLIVGSAYSAGQVLAAGIEKAGTLDRRAIRDAVRATDMMTVCGPMRFTDQGWAKDRVLVVLQWMGGRQNIVYTNKHGKKYGDMVPVTRLKWQPKWSER